MPDYTVTLELSNDITAEISAADSIVVEVPAAQGPPGPSGLASFQSTAGATIGGHRLLTTDSSGNAIYADSSTLANANAVLGLSLGSATSGTSVQVQSAGEVTDPSFAFTAGQQLWLGKTGLIATAAPSSAAGDAFSLTIGYAVNATTIFLHIGEPIILI